MSARRRRGGSESESPRDYPISSSSYSSTAFQTTSNGGGGGVPLNCDDMTCRDRTGEFMSAVKSMNGRQGNCIVPGQQFKSKGNPEVQQYNDFMKIAKHIGKDIGGTYAKLGKLTILAKRKSLFDDRPVEIEELTYIIKQDIGSLNKQIAQLQKFVKSRTTQTGHHMSTHSSSVVVSLQSKLASMSSDFKKVLEVRTENLKHQKNRRDQFTQGAVNSTLPPSAMSGYHQGSVLLADEQASSTWSSPPSGAAASGDFSINMDGGRGGAASSSSGYQQQMQLIDEQDTYLQNRAETVQNIESTIVELGGIFQQLAFMVKEQEEMIQRIDHNVEDTEMNVEAAHTELVKYFRSVTSNRWLMVKVFGILMMFFVVFVVFMA